MRELLDPGEQLFGNRVIAAGDGGGTDLSKRLMQVRLISSREKSGA